MKRTLSKYFILAYYILGVAFALYSIMAIIDESFYHPINTRYTRYFMLCVMLLGVVCKIIIKYRDVSLAGMIVDGIIVAANLVFANIFSGIFVFIIVVAEFFVLALNKSSFEFGMKKLLVLAADIEVCSILLLFASCNLNRLPTLVFRTIFPDVLLIISIIIMANKEKFTAWRNKKISIGDEIELFDADWNAIVAVGLALGVYLGVKIFCGLYADVSVRNVCSFVIFWIAELILAVLIAHSVKKNSSFSRKFTIAALGCLANELILNSFSLKSIFITLVTLVIIWIIVSMKLFEKIRYWLVGGVLLIQTVVSCINGIIVLPVVLVLVVVIASLIKKWRVTCAIVLAGVILCANLPVLYKQNLSTEKNYEELFSLCEQYEKYANLCYYGNVSSKLKTVLKKHKLKVKILNENNKEISDGDILVYDNRNGADAIISHKYCIYESDRYNIYCRNIELAESVSKDGTYYIVQGDLDATHEIVSDIDNNRAKLVLHNIDKGYHDLVVAVWSEENGQDDLEWLYLQDEGNGVFSVDIDMDTHVDMSNRITGQVLFDVYGTFENQENEYILGTAF